MRLPIMLFALLYSGILTAQPDLSGVKAHIIDEIVQKVIKPEKDQKVMVVADVSDREMRTSTGTAGTFIDFLSQRQDDSVAVRMLRDSVFVKKGKRFTFKTFNEVAYNNRNELITRQVITVRDYSSKINYLEIAAPIDGWEIGALYKQDKGLYKEDRYTQFYVPRFNIPVFIWGYNDKEKAEEKKAYLFRYELQLINDQLSVKLIDCKEI
jgi:hypothetical protein